VRAGRGRRGVAINPAALRRARLEAGLTQAEVAGEVMSKQALHAIETGQNRPTREHLLAIADRLEVPVAELLADPSDPTEREMKRLADGRRFRNLERLARQVVRDTTQSLRTHAMGRYYLGRALVDRVPGEAAGEFRAAGGLLAKMGLSDLAAEALEWQATALHHLQEPNAVDPAREALGQYRGLSERSSAVDARMLEHLGTFLLAEGCRRARRVEEGLDDMERAEEMIRASLSHYLEAGVEVGRANPLLSMGELRALQDRLEEALDWTCQAIELAERLGAPVSIAAGYQQLGELSAREGNWERFEAAFARAIEVLDAASSTNGRAEALRRYRDVRNAMI
jgi:transcriptional regulator with XRE-family HTH domain